MKSMTGYGRSRFADDEHEIEIEIKSVNGRFLDIKYRFPRELSFLESRFDAILGKKLNRGKILVNINLTNKKGTQLELNEKNLKTYWELYNKASDVLGVANDGSLSKVLAEPDVIVLQEEDPENTELLKKITKTFEEALDNHQKMALSEGDSMRKYLLESAENMLSAVKKLDATFPEYKNEIHNKIKLNIENMLKEKLDEDSLKRVMLEAAVYVEKADVTEEIVRLKDHLEKLRSKVEQNNKEAGKSINFILQEMHREINTIGSKFNYTKVFDDIILIKEEIEKCREIVQNVE
ncbi:MAG: YicC family protein [Candidatus Cloacimonetes bacterium]|nr:YicC family protein [Candidatus Cloacimonadota bacterium]MCF7814108.1 YicC family protein [Candidatus Cloacimonadota bacterium]MCF7867963.1 YicC family protein [Candidatus Cloacimonadota bacterium]MCF7883421.1 YicC family protein [Candidatus Cloacimonadota bacterium]